MSMLKEKYGCQHVLNSSSPSFLEDFQALAKELKVKCLIECVSGELTGSMMECLPARSTMLFYGALSEKPIGNIDPVLMIGRNYVLEAFILSEYIMSKGLGVLKVMKRA